MYYLEIVKAFFVIGLLVMMIANFITFAQKERSCSADESFGKKIEHWDRVVGSINRASIIGLLVLWTSLQFYSVRILKRFKDMPWEEIQNQLHMVNMGVFQKRKLGICTAFMGAYLVAIFFSLVIK